MAFSGRSRNSELGGDIEFLGCTTLDVFDFSESICTWYVIQSKFTKTNPKRNFKGGEGHGGPGSTFGSAYTQYNKLQQAFCGFPQMFSVYLAPHFQSPHMVWEPCIIVF